MLRFLMKQNIYQTDSSKFYKTPERLQISDGRAGNINNIVEELSDTQLSQNGVIGDINENQYKDYAG